MRPITPAGDLRLAAHAVTSREFRPYGRLLTAGRTLRLGPARRTLLAVHAARPAPRRVTHLVRWPKARRAVHVLGAACPSWIVVLSAGPPVEVAPRAFLLQPDQVVVLERGLWHAGPFPLREVAYAEAIESPTPAHQVDQRALFELAGVEAVEVTLPPAAGVAVGRFDLEAPHAVLCDLSLARHWRLGLVVAEQVPAAAGSDAGGRGPASAAPAARTEGADVGDPESLARLRRALRAGGADPDRSPPRLAAAGKGPGSGRADPDSRPPSDLGPQVGAALGQPFSLLDADALGEGVHARLGGPGEWMRPRGAARVALKGVPILADRLGPLASPCGDAWRAEPGPGTQRALGCLFMSAEEPAEACAATLAAAGTLLARLGALRPTGRLLLGQDEP